MELIGIEIAFAFLFAIILTAIFGFALKIRGPWNNLWVFFLVIFLAALAAGAWLTGVGPEIRGYFWLPAMVIALIIALIMAAASPASRTINESSDRTRTNEVKKEKKKDVENKITAASYYSTKATPKGEDMNEAQEQKDALVINSFIWILMALLLILAISGIFY